MWYKRISDRHRIFLDLKSELKLKSSKNYSYKTESDIVNVCFHTIGRRIIDQK